MNWLPFSAITRERSHLDGGEYYGCEHFLHRDGVVLLHMGGVQSRQ
jgi:hypothetical protein